MGPSARPASPAPDSIAPRAKSPGARGRLDDFLRRDGGEVGWTVEPLVEEAGERVYFRVRPEESAESVRTAAGPSRVLCVMASPYEPGTLPFANSTALYRELGVRAPRILEEAPELGVVALDDLGDDLLQLVAERNDPQLPALYDETVDIIARIQREGERVRATPEASRFRAYSMWLDEELFRRELRFFADHFLAGYAGLDLSGMAGRELDARCAALAAEAAGTPSALAHRDFHSRNLLALPDPPDLPSNVKPLRLHVIDHQDTRLGPRAYDLMSLVRDPYVAGEDGAAMPFREEDLVERFRDAAGLGPDSGDLRSEFDAVALQRNLKALGTYGFQIAERQNDVYRRYIPPTLRLVRENLDRHHHRAERRSLRALLADVPDESPVPAS